MSTNTDPESMFEDEIAQNLRNRPDANNEPTPDISQDDLRYFMEYNPFAYEFTPEGEFRFTGGGE